MPTPRRQALGVGALATAIVATLGTGVWAATSRTPEQVAQTVLQQVTSPTPSASPTALQAEGGGPVKAVAGLSVRSTSTRNVTVAALKKLTVPDVLVTARRPLTRAQLAALRGIQGVTDFTVFDAGAVRVGPATLRVIAADPGTIRNFMPKPTGESNGLWASQAKGEIAVAFDAAKTDKLKLGSTIEVTGLAPGAKPERRRIGAFAFFGLPTVGIVADAAHAKGFGLVPGGGVLLTARSRDPADLKAAVDKALGSDDGVQLLRPIEPAPDAQSIAAAASSLPPGGYYTLYHEAAKTCPGMSWTVLAGIGAIETNHGTEVAVSSAGAMGPMQFLPSTFAAYGVDGNHDGKIDINDPSDSVFSAANYLCADGAGAGGQALYDAIYNYNHADWYVRAVLLLAQKYGTRYGTAN